MTTASRPRTPHSRTPHPAFAALLVLALLLSQTLGFVHRIVHHGAATHGVAVAALAAPGGSAQAVQTGLQPAERQGFASPGLLERLFHHSDGDPTCRLVDQAHGFDALVSVPAVVLPLAVAHTVFAFLAREFVARRAALFDARGPPAFR